MSVESITAVLSFEDESWVAQWPWLGSEIEVVVGGGAEGPNTRLVGELARWLDRSAELAIATLDYITPKDGVRYDFTIDGLHFLWEDRPSYFIVTLSLRGDDQAIWRVEFLDGKPVGGGRDD